MNDLYLDQLTGDLAISNLDLSMVAGAERVSQQLQIKLKLWRGEWFLDTEFGTPYLQDVLGKRMSLNGAVASIKKSIMEVEGVQMIETFDYNFNRKTRMLDIQFSATTPYGLVEVLR
jgi:hypothetical protein